MTIKAARAEAAKLVNVEKDQAAMRVNEALDEYMNRIIARSTCRIAPCSAYCM